MPNLYCTTMVSLLQSFCNLVNGLNSWIGRSIGWLTTALVVLVVFDVILRKSLNLTANWVMELEWHLYAAVFLLGAAYTLRKDRHVRVDLFYARFSEREKAWVNLLGGLLLLLPWCLIMLWASWNYAMGSFEIREGSPEPGGLPARYVIKFVIAIGIGLLLLQTLSQIIENALILRKKDQA